MSTLEQTIIAVIVMLIAMGSVYLISVVIRMEFAHIAAIWALAWIAGESARRECSR